MRSQNDFSLSQEKMELIDGDHHGSVKSLLDYRLRVVPANSYLQAFLSGNLTCLRFYSFWLDF